MKAIVQERYGSADQLRLKEVDKPKPRDDEVLVRAFAAAVNAADWHLMRGDPYVARLSIGLRAPKAKIRGRDFAGRVEAVGKDVRRFHVGDEVFGELGEVEGAFAEYVHVAENVVERKPANLTTEAAAPGATLLLYGFTRPPKLAPMYAGVSTDEVRDRFGSRGWDLLSAEPVSADALVVAG